MRKRTVFQGAEISNRDCGLARLEMMTSKRLAYWRDFLRIRATRKTKKAELIEALLEAGYSVVEEGRFSKDRAMPDLEFPSLIKGYLIEDEEEYGHWAVWDPDFQCLRDPYGYRAPFRATSYTLLRKG